MRPLTALSAGEKAIVICIRGDGKLAAKLSALGIVEGAEVTLSSAHAGHPCIVVVLRSRLALSWAVVSKIMVR